MGILKTLVVSHKREANGNYVILLQKNPATNQPCLIFEAGTVVSLGPTEAEQVRRTGNFKKILDGYACLGMLQYAYEGSKEVLFLIIVTGCVSVGKIQNSEIFCVTSASLLSMRNGPGDQDLVSGLKELLNSGCFYFSHSSMNNQEPYDLTLAAQRAHTSSTTDNRFFWNRLLHRHFERFGICTSTWLVKILCGGINISTVYIGGLQAKACLISRLSCERAGTRFNVRGANDLGHVANFVETEQVIFINQIILSYITIRGSIPLFWEQPGLQVGSHRIKMSRGSEISQAAYDKHMFLLKERYENIVLINLLSSRESELPLNQLFHAHHNASRVGSEFPFITFDYHAECPRGHRENLDKLYSDKLHKYFEQFGLFHAEKGQVMQLQQGVFRVNCLDCLDRTNSMQTFIGLKMLAKIVRLIDGVEVAKVCTRLNDAYGNLWVQNGDQISKIYTGTGALEGKNLLKDGTLSVARTIQNNLLDGSKQGAIDILILGRTLNRDYSYRAASLLPHYFMYASPSILVSMCDKYLEYCVQERLKITIATWNVNGGRHFDNIMYNRARPVSDWLVDYWTNVEYGSGEADLLNQNQSRDPVDIYVVGFQEIVDLNASNIVASNTQNQRDWLLEIQKTISRDHQYLLVTSVQLVGVCLFVFIRKPLAPFIKDVCNDQVKTGLGGATGNKGGVAVRFRYKATSLCFVCAHFAAGQHQVKERNDDYSEITRRIQFPMGRSINSHDYVFWCGDFNYRLDKIANEDARRAAAAGDFKYLLAHDQLKQAQEAGQTFKGYMEGEINFAPTYKYDTNSTDYDTSEKCRVPAYTDRILFKKRQQTHEDEDLMDPNQIKFYNRIELLSSDHRPVVAEFEVEVIDVDKAARNRVLDQVLDECGPPDATVFVCVDGHLDVADEQVFAAILNLLADEAGEIVLVRYVKSNLMIIFSDGRAAVKALDLNGCPLGEHLPDNKLIITLRTSNWNQLIRAELLNNMDNATNLITGSPPKVHLEDDEDEAAQELNSILGPEVNPDSICLNHDLFMSADQQHQQTAKNLQTDPNQNIVDVQTVAFPPTEAPEFVKEILVAPKQPARPPVPPKSPLHLPSRPPPPPPIQQAQVIKPTTPMLPPQTPTGRDIRSLGSSSSSQVIQSSYSSANDRAADAFGFPTSNEQHQVTGSDLNESSDFGESTFNEQSSINLLDLSASLDFDEAPGLPPPSMAPPVLAPLTPSKLPPAIPKQAPIGVGATRPSRAAPPPPIPSRRQDREDSPPQVNNNDLDNNLGPSSAQI